MPSPIPSRRTRLERGSLLLLLITVSLALIWILLPFYGAILWSIVISLLFAPVQTRLRTRLQMGATPAALLTLSMVVLIGILPVLLISVSLTNEVAGLYLRMQAGEANPMPYLRGLFDALPADVIEALKRMGVGDFASLQRHLNASLAKISQFLASQAYSFGQNTLGFGTSVAIMLYLAFFLIRDGEQIVRQLGRAMPLAPAHKADLYDKFTTVIRATVKGNLFVAALQGLLGGLAFWFFDVGGALLWGVLMAFLSILPAVGAGLVWGPVALYFFLNGEIWQGVTMTAYGILVIGMVDNLLRPILVGKDTRMPDYLVMITTLGGMAVFGLNGFVIGPVIAAMVMAVWHIFTASREAQD
ncbi:MAG: AI-2E family transporter [Paucibacter sp.]|nr:AI-2E family transporter [Roseateles sp.]